MKKILTGQDAIDAYLQLQSSESKVRTCCGYFVAEDAGFTTYDKGTIIAFDSTSGEVYEELCGNSTESYNWIS